MHPAIVWKRVPAVMDEGHVCEAGAEPAPEDSPDWAGDTVTQATVSMVGVLGPR